MSRKKPKYKCIILNMPKTEEEKIKFNKHLTNVKIEAFRDIANCNAETAENRAYIYNGLVELEIERNNYIQKNKFTNKTIEELHCEFLATI